MPLSTSAVPRNAKAMCAIHKLMPLDLGARPRPVEVEDRLICVCCRRWQ